MKSFLPLIFLLLLIVPLSILSEGCRAGRPARKTLPDQGGGGGIEGNRGQESLSDNYSISPELPFYVSDTTISSEKFTAVYLRNPVFDSLAFNIIKSYEPFAGSLMSMIEGQGIRGVVVDLRSDAGIEPETANFTVAKHKTRDAAFGLPGSVKIIFLWDPVSADRAAGFINQLQESSLLAVTQLDNKYPFAAPGKKDCFGQTNMDFDEQ